MSGRLGILLSGRGSNFEAIAESIASGRLDAAIAVVVSNRPEAPGLEIARARGMKAVCIPSKGLEREAYAVIDEILASKPFTNEELDGWKVRSRAGAIGQAESNQSLAGALVEAQVLHGGWRAFFREQERIQSLTVDDVMAAMKRSIHRMNRTAALIVPPAAAATGAARPEGGR